MSATTHELAAERPIRILVVDDQTPFLEILSRYFGRFGYVVHTVREREEAEALLEHYEYDLVIADLGLTKVNEVEGLDIVELARYLSRKVKVIVLTGNGRGLVEEEAKRRGADVFLTKPQPLTRLGQVVTDLLTSYGGEE